jgi:hypothetical protein
VAHPEEVMSGSVSAVQNGTCWQFVFFTSPKDHLDNTYSLLTPRSQKMEIVRLWDGFYRKRLRLISHLLARNLWKIPYSESVRVLVRNMFRLADQTEALFASTEGGH